MNTTTSPSEHMEPPPDQQHSTEHTQQTQEMSRQTGKTKEGNYTARGPERETHKQTRHSQKITKEKKWKEEKLENCEAGQ